MADKKNSAEGYDRWDTIPGAMKIIGKPTAAQQKAVDAINAARAKKKQPAKKKK